MGKKTMIFFSFLVLFIITSCTNPPDNSVKCGEKTLLFEGSCCIDLNSNSICDTIETPAKIVQKECPVCDDSNKCTTDICSAQTDFECSYTKIDNCCGDLTCDVKENYYSCQSDCKDHLGEKEVEAKIKEMFKAKNYLLTEEDDAYDPDLVNYYNSGVRASITLIKNPSRFMNTRNDFRKIVLKKANNIYEELMVNITNVTADNSYRFDSNFDVDFIKTQEDDELIFYTYVFKFYEILHGARQDSSVFRFPTVDGIYAIPCTPDMVIFLNKDPSFVMYQNWDKKSDEDIQSIIDNYILNIRQQGMIPATELYNFCREKSKFRFTN